MNQYAAVATGEPTKGVEFGTIVILAGDNSHVPTIYAA